MVLADDRRTEKLQEKLFLDKLKAQQEIDRALLKETAAVHAQQRTLELKSADQRNRVRMQAIEAASAKELALAKETARAKTEIEVAQAKEATRRETQLALLAAKERAQAERQASGGGSGDTTRYGRRVGYWAMRNFSPVTPVLSYAGRLAQDVARGAGVNFDIGSMTGTRFSNERTAADISNSAFMPGDPRNGTRVATADLMSDALKAGNGAAYSQGEALAGLQSFVGISGDLATGRSVLKDMAELSRATGSNLNDMMSAAGNAANALGDMKDKGAALNAIMMAVAGQGKLGSVEVRDMAVQMAKLAASGPKFTGDVKQNIIMMGVLAQEARQRGGAASAQQSATSVMSFVNTFNKNARVKSFAAEGIEVFDKKTGLIRDPQTLITEALRRTGGDQIRMGKMFMDAQARRAVSGFENLFHASGGGETGIKAVEAEFDRLKKAAISEEEKRESLARAMETAEAKAQLFQNQIQEVVGAMADKLVPTLTELAPKAFQLVETFGKIVEWAAGNPLQAIPALLGAAIAKSAVEQAVRGGIETMFSKLGSMGGLAFTAAAITVTATEGLVKFEREREEGAKGRVTSMVEGLEKSRQKVQTAEGELGEATAAGDSARAEKAKKRVEEAKDELNRALNFTSEQVIGTAKKGPNAVDGTVANTIKNVVGRITDPGGMAMQDEMIRRMGELAAVLGKAQETLSGKGTISVHVENMPGPGSPAAPGIDNSNRSSVQPAP